jgi:acetyltransferase-like isoleucine patch superfamily enzyme
MSDDSERDPQGRATDRRERTTAHERPGPHNSLHAWYRARHPLRVAVNYAVILVCRISPSLRLKRVLFRWLGMDVGPGVAWAIESTPDIFWPELITVEADAIVGYDATILCHEFLQNEYRTGEVVIRRNAMIGAGAVVLPGVEIGEGAQVAANSLVTEDVPPGATVAGVPATVGDDGDDGSADDSGESGGHSGDGDESRSDPES